MWASERWLTCFPLSYQRLDFFAGIVGVLPILAIIVPMSIETNNNQAYFRHFRTTIAKSDYYILHVRPSAWKFSFSCLCFLEIVYWGLLLNFVLKIQVCLKFNKKKRHFTWRPTYTCDYVVRLWFPD